MNGLAEWLTGRLLNYSLDKLREKIRGPKVIEAFERACEKVINEGNDFLSKYTLQALSSDIGILQGEDLVTHLLRIFDRGDFPTIENLTSILMDSWQRCKDLLNPSEAAPFFAISADEARPKIAKIVKYFFKELTQISEFSTPFIIKRLQEATSHESEAQLVDLSDLIKRMAMASASLTKWPSTLGNNRWINRPELQFLIDRIDSKDNSTTILLGSPGSGKSALLAVLAQYYIRKGIVVLAIKADKLPSAIDNTEKLTDYLNLPFPVDKTLQLLAESAKVVLIIDQLDAVSDLVDLKSERLNILLALIQKLSSLLGIHIVSSSRWFEYKHDTRLNTVDAEHLELRPMPWEDVNAVLKETGIDGERLSPQAQELLSIPLHLKLYLDVLTRNPSIDLSYSLQGLLEAIWNQKVLNRDGITGKAELIHKLSEKIIVDEEFWVPRALGDDSIDALSSLEREDILVLDESGLRIGFRHQTYFDFSRARYFAQGCERLSEYVLLRQDGLFIRPILLSILGYLRGADPPTYKRELLALWENLQLRKHLRFLLIEFLGSQANPNEVEISCLLPMLSDASNMNRTLMSLAGSPGWFIIIKESYLPDLMVKTPEVAQSCVLLLIQALSFKRRDVLRLLQRCWLPNIGFDGLMLRVLQNLREWDGEAASVVCTIAERTEDWNVGYIIEIVSQVAPELAPKIVRADFERRLMRAEKEDNEHPILTPPPPHSSVEEQAIYSISNDPIKNRKQLLELHLTTHDLSIIAETSPKAFLEHVWPWFLKVLEKIAYEPHPFVLGYMDDHSLGTTLDRSYEREYQPVPAIKDAIEKLAEIDPPSFFSFFRDNESSQYLTVHRLLCRGLKKVAIRNPGVILDYLISDPRRLVIGDFSDCHKESRDLIAAVAPHLDEEELRNLEKAVLEWNRYYRAESNWTAEDKRNRFRWNRQHRLRLLRAFPEDCLSENTRKLRTEEERAFPGLRDWDSKIGEVGIVGSAMSKEEMEKAKDEDIINLFEELNDSTGWDHPRHKWESGKFLGGVIQAARELEGLAEKDPQKAVALLPHLKPGLQETPAGSIIEGLAKSSFPSEKLLSAIFELNERGFVSNSFRTDAARALEGRAHKENGLPDNVIQMMESWLPTHTFPALEEIKPAKEADREESILWGYGIFFSIPGGRDLIFTAIAKGYLLRKPPGLEEWAAIIKRALAYEKHPDIWHIILMHMPVLLKGSRDKATYLYDQIITKQLMGKMTCTDFRSLADIVHLVPDLEVLKRWLTLIRESGGPKGPQAFGEMLMLYLCWKPIDNWAKKEVQRYLESPESGLVKRGLAYSAAECWHLPSCQDVCTFVLVALCNSSDEITGTAISRVFRVQERVPLSANMKQIIEGIIENDKILVKSAEALIEGVEYATSIEPELVSRICNRFLDIGIEAIGNMATRFALLAEPLVSIALTLHRMPPPFRASGLRIFERLLESNIPAARQALDILDRRPISTGPQQIPPGRRRRRRVK